MKLTSTEELVDRAVFEHDQIVQSQNVEGGLIRHLHVHRKGGRTQRLSDEEEVMGLGI
jgi:hypothetical protein